MARPFDAREMEARVEALLLRFQRSKDLGPVISADGLTLARARRTVAVYSPKGGVGTTTVADERRDRGGRRPARQGRPGRLRPPVRRRRDAPQPRPEADDRRRRPRRDRRCASRSCCGPTRCATTAVCTCWPRRPRPSRRRRSPRPHVAQVLSTLLDGYDMVVDRRRVDARRAGPDDLRGRRDRAAHGHPGDRRAQGDACACSNTWARPGRSRSSRGSCSTTCSPARSSRSATSRASSGAKMAVELPYDPFLYLKAVNEGVPIVTGRARALRRPSASSS